MSSQKKYDLAIIGAGAAGLSIAAVAAPLGLKVVVIEENKMGGECLNSGCIPSKSFIAAAKTAHTFLTAESFGIAATTPQVHFNKVMEQVNAVIQTIAPHDSVERFTQLGAEVIHASAQFIDANTLIAGDATIKARQFVIATGSAAAIPPICGLNQVNYFTNETIFQLREKPSHLIVIGGGPIGCELAQAFLLLGVKVTLLEALHVLPRDEPELVAILQQQLQQQGLQLHENVSVVDVKEINKNLEITIEKNNCKEMITGSHLLIATGRQANIKSLHLEKAGITFTNKNIIVDKRLRTTNKKVYAIGDVVGPYQFTHMANYQASIVIKNAIFKIPAQVNYDAVPWVTYTTPELAHVGPTTAEILKKDATVKIIMVALAENDRAQTERETIGKIKITTTAKGKILNATILAPHAGELILPWVMLMKDKKNLRQLTELIIPYPTLNEISKRVASEFYRPALFSSAVRRIVNVLKYI